MWTIDFEASGLSRYSYPIEVGITNGTTEYQAYIKPLPQWEHWDDKAEAIHGISRDKLHALGKPAAEVARQMNTLLKGQIVFCDVLQWDAFWNNALFIDTGIRCEFEIEDIAHYLFDAGINVDDMLARREALFNSGQFTLHSALDDARTLYLACSGPVQ
jgi:DNA polymerase III epsilon subunit-like protein